MIIAMLILIVIHTEKMMIIIVMIIKKILMPILACATLMEGCQRSLNLFKWAKLNNKIFIVFFIIIIIVWIFVNYILQTRVHRWTFQFKREVGHLQRSVGGKRVKWSEVKWSEKSPFDASHKHLGPKPVFLKRGDFKQDKDSKSSPRWPIFSSTNIC